jgi:hypothetical protein
MPKKIHDKLEREAQKKGFKGKKKDAYVYGTLARIEKKVGKKKKS